MSKNKKKTENLMEKVIKMRLFDNSWDLRVGEVQLTSDGDQYSLVVGYPERNYLGDDHRFLYFRLYDKENSLMYGTWLRDLTTSKWEAIRGLNPKHKQSLSIQLMEEIIKQAKRLESLKALA
jgi:hypothetical protein